MNFLKNTLLSFKAIGKCLLLSRPCTKLSGKAEGSRLIILANGPSLADTIRENMEFLKSAPTMAVNFAAIADDFTELKPRYYVLADPHFFKEDSEDSNLKKLRERLKAVDWKMTLFVPRGCGKAAAKLYGTGLDIATFNNVGAEGFKFLTHTLFRLGAAMPRPRNVLIPSLMLAIGMDYKEILIFGADHSWMKTLSVTDDNEVVSVQPHFYNDGKEEQERVRHEYRNYRLHQIVESFAIAFKSYHDIADYAARRGARIFNCTPGSFIDAFERRKPQF